MITPGLSVIGALVVVLAFFAIAGIRLVGWGGIALGACGIVYSVSISPAYMVLATLPISGILFLVGVIAVALRHFRASA